MIVSAVRERRVVVVSQKLATTAMGSVANPNFVKIRGDGVARHATWR